MGMALGDKLRITLFGESHGTCVGALVEGMPPGTPMDPESLSREIDRRKPGRKGLSSRKEVDECQILSGVYEGKATGWPILMLTMNSDVRSSDYSFLPDHPRPGHADMVEMVRSEGSSDLRGGGSQSARLTFGMVAAGSQAKALLGQAGWSCKAHLHSVGEVKSRPLFELDRDSELKSNSDMARLNCRDPDAVGMISDFIESVRMDRDSVGSVVELLIEGVPIGVGEPWFDGVEPSLARAMMAIPGARAVEFSHGVESSKMRGSEHNDSWHSEDGSPVLEGASSGEADGSLGGRSTGAPIRVKVHFKPPSSFPRKQFTLHLPSDELMPLEVGGRHDPVLGPRAVPVVEAAAILVMADLGLMGGFIEPKED
jgi:chorismate synthase